MTRRAPHFRQQWVGSGADRHQEPVYVHESPAVPLSERRDLCDARVTLNGRPARISGAHLRFARVTDAETGLGAEWSWEAVARVVSKGGRFES